MSDKEKVRSLMNSAGRVYNDIQDMDGEILKLSVSIKKVEDRLMAMVVELKELIERTDVK